MPNPLEVSGRRISPPAIPPDLPLLTHRALELALAQYGVREDRGRPNRGAKVDEYVRGVSGRFGYLLGSSWCGMFARWPWDAAALELGVPSPLPAGRDLASARKWLDWAESVGRLVAQPEPGCVGLLLHPDGVHGHVYLVVDTMLGDDLTIEGNSGDRVDCRARSSALAAGYVRVG